MEPVRPVASSPSRTSTVQPCRPRTARCSSSPPKPTSPVTIPPPSPTSTAMSPRTARWAASPSPRRRARRPANLGAASGGAYGPVGVPMTADGSEIFFQSPDPLVPQDLNSDTPPAGLFGFLGTADVYEWENGNVFLISDGRAPGSFLGS